MTQVLQFTGLFLLAFTLVGAGMPGMAMALFPLPVAVYWARGLQRQSGILLVCAGLSVLLATGSAVLAVMFMVVAGTGVLAGEMAVRRWSFGQCVALLTAVVFGFLAVSQLANWAAVREEGIVFVLARLEGNPAAGEVGPWMEAHYDDMFFGTLFGSVLAGMTLFVAFFRRWLELKQVPAGLRGSFAAMRPPEWLVWAVIAVALLWFAEQRWSHDLLRAVTWNSAIALAVLYALNGFALVLYALQGLQASPLLAYASVFGLLVLLPNTLPMLAFTGLFDTWWNLRQKVDRLASARRAENEKNGTGAP
jgi:uncharacterized protein YybS (DUF2232 family)